jgi:hypothetical protein
MPAMGPMLECLMGMSPMAPQLISVCEKLMRGLLKDNSL